eukprot:m.329190 g.329190  ORF g.329190 m.329190 type:complete len:324 (+) comp55598_c0_seq1:347-1318(+)
MTDTTQPLPVLFGSELAGSFKPGLLAVAPPPMLPSAQQCSLPAAGRRFTQQRLLGKGTFSRVHAAFDHQRSHFVALKLSAKAPDSAPQPGAQTYARQLQEFLIGNLLEHPNIVRALDFHVENDVVVLVQELASGGDVYDRIEAGVGVPPAFAHSVMRQLACALRYLEHCQIVHCDVKPENLVITASGAIKLCDFGMAEVAGAILPGAPGTIAYMAPEMISRRAFAVHGLPVDYSADMWSLGVVLFVLLTGQHPWLKARIDDDHYTAYRTDAHLAKSTGWQRLPMPFHALLKRLFEACPLHRCRLVEVEQFLDFNWHLAFELPN